MRASEAIRIGRIDGRRTRRGQSLIVAVIVMFVLLFIGAVFVGLVARNLLNSGRAKDTVSAAQFAEAGIQYANTFLQNSPLGADWRPAIVPVANVNPDDPDFLWLSQGYSRVDLNGGRALIKVTYRPDTLDRSYLATDTLDPLGKYIKIESFGRVGNINANDPTTFLNSPSPRLRRAYVAYKDMGLTSYLRYVTNHNKDTKAEAYFGVQAGVPVFMQMGGLPVNAGYNLPPFLRTTGAPMRINAKTRFGHNLVLGLDRRNGDAIQVADDILVDPDVNGDPTQFGPRLNALDVNAPNADPTVGAGNGTVKITPTDGPFNTVAGLIRDAAGIPDINGYVRAISRLDPPLLDVEDESTGLTRYRQLTRGSGKYLPNPNNVNRPFDLGRIGLGSGMYIDNFGDWDQNPNVSDADTLSRIWLNPGSSSDWNGPYYIPPGVTVEFGYPIAPDHKADASLAGTFSPHAGFRVARNPAKDPNFFRDLQGQKLSTSTLDFTYLIYVPAAGPPVLKLDCDNYRNELRNAPFSMSEQQIDKTLADFNGVVYAEGNVRVRGLLAGTKNVPIRRENGANPLTDQQIRDLISTGLTVVSGSNIYIESSLLREDPRSMLALLAVENVVVNPTMFTAVSASRMAFTADQDPLGHFTVDRGDVWNMDFLFGENPAGYVDQNGNNVPISLLLRHGVQGQDTTYLNLFVNEWADRSNNLPLYWFKVTDPLSPTLPPWTYPLHNAVDTASFEYRVFPLATVKSGDPNNPYLFTGDAGYPWPQGLRNVVRANLDTSYANGAPAGPYLFGRAAVVPMDVRIEAVMYAQNGEFFIVPGQPINNNLGVDTRESDLARAKNTAGNPLGALERFGGTDALFPLAGEPMDSRITIIGAITENRTASAADQAEWMKLWGWIPQSYGSTGHDTRNINAAANEIPKAHLFVNDVSGASVDMRFDAEKNAALGDASVKVGLTRGLRFIYDPALLMPYANYTPGSRAFRSDLANFDAVTNPVPNPDRTLPPVPRLPVCPGFAFYGEVR